MALATQCPHCNTIFRVAADQLKLRGGIVRCGKCSEVFDGNATLIQYPVAHEAPPVEQETPVTEPVSEDDERPIYTLDFDTTFDPYGILPKPDPTPEPVVDENQADLFAAAPTGEALPGEEDIQTDPEPQADTHPEPEAEPEPEQEPEQELQPEPEAASDPGPEPVPTPAPDPEPVAVSEAEPPFDPDYEPEFLLRERRREQSSRILRPLMFIGILLLLGGIAVQGILNFHDQLAAWQPSLKPTLATACKSLGCKVTLPMQAEALSVETGQLEPVAATTFSYTTLLRNSSKSVQAWPYLELALTDAEDRQLVRRVLVPKDYLPAGTDLSKGFAARTEQPVKIYFELKDVKASGYRIAVFYP
jgi:predicted Zn finger-like uncharacterized protein